MGGYSLVNCIKLFSAFLFTRHSPVRTNLGTTGYRPNPSHYQLISLNGSYCYWEAWHNPVSLSHNLSLPPRRITSRTIKRRVWGITGYFYQKTQVFPVHWVQITGFWLGKVATKCLTGDNFYSSSLITIHRLHSFVKETDNCSWLGFREIFWQSLSTTSVMFELYV